MIKVYDDYREIVGEVEYNNNLDFWENNNRSCGSIGRHKGLTRLKKKYVLIHVSQWPGEQDYAELIGANQAKQEIIDSGNEKLFEEFPELNDFFLVS